MGIQSITTECRKAGIPMIVARGDVPDILLRLFENESLGTYFVPKEEKMAQRKCWIAYTLVGNIMTK